ncbi:uncharacterized protein BJ171DRAFT_505077, partial [Polychytrium aggregatum]|uniref:uncharacterized protein n=1 Tax=Polychytrium aggregatum TaxID=110093 RepID=UPI0022FE2C50
MAPKQPASSTPLVDEPTIQHATLHTPRPIEQHIYTTPSLVLYAVWLYLYLYKYEQFMGSREFTLLSFLLCLALHALAFLICQWSVELKAFLTCTRESDPFKAKVISVIPTVHNGQSAMCPIESAVIKTAEGSKRELFFFFQKQKFMYDEQKQQFCKLDYPDSASHTFEEYRRKTGVISDDDLNALAAKYGQNKFDIPIPSFQELFKEHLVAPFFVFQLFCVALWFLDDMWYYSLFTLFMLFVFESTVVFQRLRNLQEFRSMSIKPYPIPVYRNGKWTQIQTDDLVPGDICSVSRCVDDNPVPADMLIIDGSCIANEAMLSGESTPQLKESIASRDATDLFDISSDKNNVLFGGTKVLQVTPPQSTSSINTPDDGCLAFVLRTGFATEQGKLVRTIVYSTERITANNLESLFFILFLLIFAIAASWYVWVEGSQNEERKRSKVLLDCILIITSVVPPELPMELSLAVNNSLIALAKVYIFCTEPFRIPFAGKIDIACFDKTGTLTVENLLVEGVAGLDFDKDATLADKAAIKKKDRFPRETTFTLAAAHALVQLEDGTIGDPMEKNTLESIEWAMQPGDFVIPAADAATKRSSKDSIRILRRFPFSSSLKRMSTVSLLATAEHTQPRTFVAVKGAPETLREMYTSVPESYDDIYKYWARRGSRVLALGYKFLEGTKAAQSRHLLREEIESNLHFAGFLVFHCPLKPDAVQAVKMLSSSSHRVVMITGDNALTACHVASEVQIATRDVLIGDVRDGDALTWRTIDESIEFSVDLQESSIAKRLTQYDLCITGRGLAVIQNTPMYAELLPRLWVYARVSPSQKETILTDMKKAGYTTLMCGDGTNDVGALKQAHVGIALLDGKAEDIERLNEIMKQRRLKAIKEQQEAMRQKWGLPAMPDQPPQTQVVGQPNRNARGADLQAKTKQLEEQIQNMMNDMDGEVPTIKFGDASVAAPFTSKLSSVMSVVNIVRQGRSTLVAMMQMYKILALNCLISAYSMSVLYLAGIKQGDWQATIGGMMMTVCFFAIAKSSSVETLSKKRPQANIFNLYIILSVLGQAAIHVTSLIYIRQLAIDYSEDLDENINLDAEFQPNLLNSAVYLVSLIMQISTFAINYQGRPFRESLVENKPLYNSLFSVTCIAFAAATEFSSVLNDWMQLVPFPDDFRYKLLATMVFDFGGAWLWEMGMATMFSDNRPKPSLLL